MQAMRALLHPLALPCVAALLLIGAADPTHAQHASRMDVFTIPAGPALSRGAMFHSLAGYRIPDGGLQAGIVCKIAPDGPRLTDCTADEKTPAEAVPAVRRRLKMNLDLPPRAASAIARGSVFLRPSDYPALTEEMATKATPLLLPTGWTGWEVQPSASYIDRFYPERALRLEREARVGAICQIQTDGSLACPLVLTSVPGFGFEVAGLQVLEFFRAKPTLPEGGASAGAWVRMRVDFRIPS